MATAPQTLNAALCSIAWIVKQAASLLPTAEEVEAKLAQDGAAT